MYRTVSFFLSTAFIGLWLQGTSPQPALANPEDGACPPKTVLGRVVNGYRAANQFVYPELAEVHAEVRGLLTRYIQTVESNPWAPPEVAAWRSIVLGRASRNPVPRGQTPMPTSSVRSTIEAFRWKTMARSPSLSNRAQDLLARESITYGEYVEYCVDSLLTLNHRLSTRERNRLRASLMSGFIDSPPSSAIRIPVFRERTPNDALTGGGPHIVSFYETSDLTGIELALTQVNDHSAATGLLNNINPQLVGNYAIDSQVGPLHFVEHADLAIRIQQDSSRFAQAVEELRARDPELATFLQRWAARAFNDSGVPVSFDTLKQSIGDDLNPFYTDAFRREALQFYGMARGEPIIGTERWNSLRNRIWVWLAMQRP